MLTAAPYYQASHRPPNDDLAIDQPPPHDPAVSASFQPTYPPGSPLATPPATSLSPAFATDHPQVALPKLGQTRCYWSLLSSDLQFIYLDPILTRHLEEQAEGLVGQSLFAFVHPDERETAKQDLGNVLESKTLHGSVTRVRFSRLSKVRRDLGHRGPTVTWPGADKVSLDDDYMAVEIVINWAADGLVLCFIHATVDLSPGDNDEQQKTQWTNWCETPFMGQDQISLLFRRLLVCIPQTGSMNRVFQILSNNAAKTLLLSWPPDPSQLAEGGAQGFAKLVETVNMATGLSGANDAKTSCTRRFKALHDIPSFGGEVESIFIPHGSIIFACHKVSPSSRGAVNSTSAMQQLAFAPSGYNSHAGSTFYDPSPYTLPPISTQEPYAYMPQHGSGPYSPQRWPQSNVGSVLSNIRTNSYAQPSEAQTQQSWQQSASQTGGYVEANPPTANGNRGPSSPYLYSPATTTSENSSPTTDVVPPPRRRVSPGSHKDENGPSARSQNNRPVGLLKCSSCKTTSSPEWRKGPSGKKELCNACGLRYARSRAKKEGLVQNQRRRKDKGSGALKRDLSTLQVSVPPTSYELRRSYDDSSFATTSAVSAGGNVYPHGNPPTLESMTPSPSPPGSAVNFMHYSATSDGRAHPGYGNSAGSYFGGPPESSPVSHEPAPAPAHHPFPQLPPLGQIATFADRLSPMVPSTPPITLSSFASTAPASSYERDRERDGCLKSGGSKEWIRHTAEAGRDYHDLPTPLSAEPRMKRTLLSHQ